MVLSAATSTSYDLSGLSAQIADSVRLIKSKAVTVPEFSASNSQGSATTSNPMQAFSLHNFTVSYLEPGSLYSIQRIVSESPQELTEQESRNQLRPDTEKETENTGINPQEIEGLGFNSELEKIFSAADYANATAVYQQGYSVDVPEVTLLFGGTSATEEPAHYAAQAYSTAANLNQRSVPLIELMHEFNRNFDYTI